MLAFSRAKTQKHEIYARRGVCWCELRFLVQDNVCNATTVTLILFECAPPSSYLFHTGGDVLYMIQQVSPLL